MILSEPILTELDMKVIREIEEDRKSLRYTLATPRRWLGVLRRNTFARGIRGSNSIEGYDVSQEDAIAIVEGEEPLEAEKETRLAVIGYRDAMTYVLQLAADSQFSYSAGFIRSMQYMMTKYDLKKNPGLWRPGQIFVFDDIKQKQVYEGPDFRLVTPLVDELIAYLNAPSSSHALIRAALAHLNLVMIHPFSDGNGRMARCLQTLVLAREGILEPQFCSIEEYLGKNTQEYYDVLADVGQGGWHPENNTHKWIRFCLKAHYQQAKTLIRRAEQLKNAWTRIEELSKKFKLQERTQFALLDATFGLRIRNSNYRLSADIPEYVASRDLKHLVQVGLLVADGEKRGRYYKAGETLQTIRREVSLSKEIADPFAQGDQLLLSPSI